jgi:transposase
VLQETQDDAQVVERVAALDIGKAEVVCCVRVPSSTGSRRRAQEVRTFTTMTREPPWIFRRENQLRSFLFWKERGNGDGEAAQVLHA